MVRGEVNQQRLTLLASILLWEGRLNNARLREIFDLSSVRASEWIREFRETCPGWTEWNSKTRSYHATMKAYRSDGSREQRKQSDATSLSQYLGLVGIPHSVTEPSQSRAIWAAFPDLSVPSPRTFALVTGDSPAATAYLRRQFGDLRRATTDSEALAQGKRTLTQDGMLVSTGEVERLRLVRPEAFRIGAGGSGQRDALHREIEGHKAELARLERDRTSVKQLLLVAVTKLHSCAAAGPKHATKSGGINDEVDQAPNRGKSCGPSTFKREFTRGLWRIV